MSEENLNKANSIKIFRLSTDDKKAIASSFKQFSDAFLSAIEDAINLSKASKMINHDNNLRVKKPFYRANDRY